MIKLIDILKEAKQVGIVYHYTPLENLESIIKNRYIFPNDEQQISTTRNPLIYTLIFSEEENNLARLMLDGNKISNKYKIRPFSYDSVGRMGDQFEEQIVVNGKNFYFFPYLKRIDLFITNPEDKKILKIKNILEKANIPYTIYNKSNTQIIPYTQSKEGNPKDINIKKLPKPVDATEEALYFPGIPKNKILSTAGIPNMGVTRVAELPEYPGYYAIPGHKSWLESNSKEFPFDVKIVDIPMYNDPKWRAKWKYHRFLKGFSKGSVYDSYMLLPKNKVPSEWLKPYKYLYK